MSIRRREFLELLLGLGAGAAAGGFGLTPERAREMRAPAAFAPRAPRSERQVATTCGLCAGGCGMLVRTIDGRAISVRGNPDHPLNRGGLCPKGLAAIESLNDPDRPRLPLRRAGPRGAGRLVPVSWEEAIATLAAELRALRQNEEPHALAVLLGEGRGLLPRLFARFAGAYGTPNVVTASSPFEEPLRAVARLTQGLDRAPAYDLDASALVLSFGASLLEGFGAPGRTMSAFGRLRAARRGQRPRLIQVEPRLSVTAAKADEWVQIRPGTAGTLALGIAYVLLREELYDRRFVDEHVAGLDEFRALVLRSYHLDRVSKETGVPVATVARLAKELGRTRPAIALGEGGTTNGTASLLAIHALNALTGSIDVPGGVIFPRDPPEPALAPPAHDAAALAGLARSRLDGALGPRYPLAPSVLDELPAAIEAGAPYALRAAIVRGVDPLHDAPAPARFRKALEKVPFVAVIGPVLDETAAAADLFLPEPHFLERFEDDPAPPCGRFAALSLRQPVEVRAGAPLPAGEVLIRLARALGGTVAAAFPWKDWSEAASSAVDAVFAARRGSIFEPRGRPSFTEQLADRGWWWPSYASPKELLDQMLEKGGWWDPTYDFGAWARVLRTPSGRFELPAERLAAAEPARFDGDEKRFPFVLAPYRVLALGGAAAANLPLLEEIAGVHVRERWETWVEVHPDVAARLGVADRDLVTVETPRGEFRARARLYPGASPDLIAVPLGLGHRAGGRHAAGRGANPLEPLALAMDALAGVAAPVSTRARLVKV